MCLKKIGAAPLFDTKKPLP